MVLIASIAALTRIVLGLTTDNFSVTAPAVLWMLSIGIALTVAISIGLLVRCLSSWRNFKLLHSRQAGMGAIQSAMGSQG